LKGLKIIIQVNNIVKIKKTIDDSCPIDKQYINKQGIVKEINKDRPAPITVFIENIGEDSFWEEELAILF